MGKTQCAVFIISLPLIVLLGLTFLAAAYSISVHRAHHLSLLHKGAVDCFEHAETIHHAGACYSCVPCRNSTTGPSALSHSHFMLRVAQRNTSLHVLDRAFEYLEHIGCEDHPVAAPLVTRAVLWLTEAVMQYELEFFYLAIGTLCAVWSVATLAVVSFVLHVTGHSCTRIALILSAIRRTVLAPTANTTVPTEEKKEEQPRATATIAANTYQPKYLNRQHQE